MLRTLLEKWSRGVVLKKKLPAEFGSRPIFVSPEGGGLRYWKPSLDMIDPMLTQAVRQFVQPGDTVWDIGGNLGFFAFPAAAKVGPSGQVIVFEPDLFLAHILRKTADANPDLNVNILTLAASDRQGIARFNIAERARSTNFLADASGSTQTGGVRRTILVPTMPLDSMLAQIPSPNFVKIDVEGAENLVFEGMRQVLQEARPVILCEVFKVNWEAISKNLLAHGYRIFDANRLPEMVEADASIENILAIPA
jgi:FkbM family methyltransferase